MLSSSIARGFAALIALVFVALFAFFWIDVLRDIGAFKTTKAAPKLLLSDAQQTILSVLSTAVATGTAAVLGITIVEVNRTRSDEFVEGTNPNRWQVLLSVVKHVARASTVLWIGILAYLIVGVLVLITWWNDKSGITPELVGTFGASVLGWGAGAIAAVFKASTV